MEQGPGYISEIFEIIQDVKLFTKMARGWVGESYQCIRCLLYRQNDLSSHPYYPCKSWAGMVVPVIPALGRQQLGIYRASWVNRLAEWEISGFHALMDLALVNKVEGNQGRYPTSNSGLHEHPHTPAMSHT